MVPQQQRPSDDESSSYYRSYILLVPDGDIVQSLRSQAAELCGLLHDLDELRATASPAAGAWSVKQVLQHLCDTERLFCFRALWFARGEQTALPGMEPDPWVAQSAANGRSLVDLLGEHGHVRAASLALFAQLDHAAWLRRGVASDAPVSVRALAWIIAGHERHHLGALQQWALR